MGFTSQDYTCLVRIQFLLHKSLLPEAAGRIPNSLEGSDINL